MLPCVMGAYCVAVASATELSERMLAARARLIGAATLALTSDICSRSGSCSPTWDSSSSVESASESLPPVPLRVSFAMVDLLVIRLLCLRLRPCPSPSLNDAAVAFRARRNPRIAGGDRRVDVGDDIHATPAVADELVYHFMHDRPSFYMIGSFACQRSVLRDWVTVTWREVHSNRRYTRWRQR